MPLQTPFRLLYVAAGLTMVYALFIGWEYAIVHSHTQQWEIREQLGVIWTLSSALALGIGVMVVVAKYLIDVAVQPDKKGPRREVEVVGARTIEKRRIIMWTYIITWITLIVISGHSFYIIIEKVQREVYDRSFVIGSLFKMFALMSNLIVTMLCPGEILHILHPKKTTINIVAQTPRGFETNASSISPPAEPAAESHVIPIQQTGDEGTTSRRNSALELAIKRRPSRMLTKETVV